MKTIFLFLLLMIVTIQVRSNDSISVSSPTTRIVYQRNNKDMAFVLVQGTCPATARIVEARLVTRNPAKEKTTDWISVDEQSGRFSGRVQGSGGWYDLEIRARKKKKILAVTKVERIGIGEVFVIAGHSVAQGGDINMEGSADDRVSLVRVYEHSDRNERYLKTADPQYLPDPVFEQAATDVAPAPFGHNTYFWSKFGELIAKKENVPVLIFNAAFGGTSLEHWAKSAHNIQFEHGFVRSGIRMPYINIYNTFKKYVALTGVRAILADQGQNDAGQKNADSIFKNYGIFIAKAREDLGYPDLALVVNRQTPSNSPQVREAQERMAREPHSFTGPDYDNGLISADKTDGIHLSAAGLPKAAQLWADALTPEFFRQAVPWLPSFHQ